MPGAKPDEPPGPSLGPLVDHHCHGLVLDDLDRSGFEALMNEGVGSSPLGTTVFDSMLGVAIRRWCAPVLDLEPHASPDDYLARRRDLGAVESSRRLLAASDITDFLVDTGLTSHGVCAPDELASLVDGTAHEVVRLERLAEEVLAEDVSDRDFADTMEERLRGSGAVAAKSIAAYRVGLELPPAGPSGAEVQQAVGQVRAAGDTRLAHPLVSGWLAWTALRIGMPLQVHVGYGDRDLDLRSADPRLLTGFLRASEPLAVPVLLLHNYPEHRAAAYLAQVFDHVFVDVGLATHNTGALSRRLLEETLELVPFGKLLFSTDGYALAELFHLGSLLFRRSWSAVMGALVAEGELASTDVEWIGRLVARENARRVYGLER
jgi:uncharacterized protein